MAARLTAITVYPVKSTAGLRVDRVSVEKIGLEGDRRWMVVDADGECVTGRRDRRLLQVTATLTPTGLSLSRGPGGSDTADGAAAHGDVVEVPRPTGPTVEVSVHGRPLRGIPAPPEVSAWVGAALGRTDVRLVHLAAPRPLNPAHSQTGDATAFADGYPVSLASGASLRRVRDWVVETALERGEEPDLIPMTRFRPNLVIDGGGDLEAFAEDHWRSVCVGDVRFDVAKAIDRCVLTTIDPATLRSGHEPIRSLSRHHAWDGATWFGVQLIPRTTGTVCVGDDVTPGPRTR